MTAVALPSSVSDAAVGCERSSGDDGRVGAPGSCPLPNVVEFLDYNVGVGLRRFVVGPLATNCWAVFSLATGTALIVDPGEGPDTIISATQDLDQVAVVLTHCHLRNERRLPDLAADFGVPVLAHSIPDRSVRDGVQEPLHDEQVLRLGPLSVRVIHTPDHRSGEISLVVANHVLTGNALERGGVRSKVGRGAGVATAAESLRRRLLGLHGTMLIHPGRGPSTVIGDQQPRCSGWIARSARLGLVARDERDVRLVDHHAWTAVRASDTAPTAHAASRRSRHAAATIVVNNSSRFDAASMLIER